MKRDLDLIRDILLKMESSDEESFDFDFFIFDEYSSDIVYFHLKLLCDARYITGRIIKDINDEYSGRGIRITMSGCEYIDSIRDNKVWAAVKDKLSKSAVGVGSVALEIIKSVATDFVLKQFTSSS